MRRIRGFLTILCVACTNMFLAQSVTLNGTVYATSNVEGIHVINKTARKATTTGVSGLFSIQVSLSDTLVFSGVQYKLHSVLVDSNMMETKTVAVFLTENVNQLDEVVVGKVLTGDLLSDIENANVKPDINFYDVGIPGYQGPMPTQNERKLIEADHGKFLYYYGIGFAVNINKLLNAVSGRTKKLKLHVELEAKDELMYRAKAKYSEVLFAENPLEQSLRYEFFYFCSEDPEFETMCTSENELETMAFFQQKLKRYKNQLKNE